MSARRAWLRPGALAVIALALVAAGVVISGILPLADAGALAGRTTPVLGFVSAITMVAEPARDAGLFVVIAQQL
ncbi:MAG: arsenic transporter, partial [Microbacterium sp.]|nr:arsenic transporter [Microbacterium sp.]